MTKETPNAPSQQVQITGIRVTKDGQRLVRVVTQKGVVTWIPAERLKP